MKKSIHKSYQILNYHHIKMKQSYELKLIHYGVAYKTIKQ